MALLNDNPEAVRELLENARVIAVVGMSDNPARPSSGVAKFLKNQGYTIYPVNPTLDSIDGEKVYHSLNDIPEPIDIVDVFRRPEYLEGVVDEAIKANAKAVWGQLGIHTDAAVEKANAAGLDIVTNHCAKIEFMRLGVRKKV
jgi:uncharacterized protein